MEKETFYSSILLNKLNKKGKRICQDKDKEQFF